MKPREFDDLVKHKFDEGGFEYKPQNWERLAEQLDGREKKRGLLVWWMPLMGVAASVALAMGVPVVLKEGASTNQNKAIYAQAAAATETPQDATIAYVPAGAVAANLQQEVALAPPPPQAKKEVTDDVSEIVAADKVHEELAVSSPHSINLTHIFKSKAVVKEFNIPVETFAVTQKDIKKVKKALPSIGFYTFKETQSSKNMSKLAISVSGGVNYGAQSNGFIVGATARRMVNDKVFVEGDIAFIGTNNSSTYSEVVYSGASTSNDIAANSRMSPGQGGAVSNNSGAAPVAAAPAGMAARGVVNSKSTNDAVITPTPAPSSHVVTTEKAYNLYYAQVTPTIGYKIMKRMSVGIGPDFQQMLGDNRPAVSPTETGNIQEVPMFDIGFMGKTEYAISKNIKAAVYYREGINNIITPMNRFIDRNYVQFQVKCAILNR